MIFDNKPDVLGYTAPTTVTFVTAKVKQIQGQTFKKRGWRREGWHKIEKGRQQIRGSEQ